jgi:hypothetical protein
VKATTLISYSIGLLTIKKSMVLSAVLLAALPVLGRQKTVTVSIQDCTGSAIVAVDQLSVDLPFDGSPATARNGQDIDLTMPAPPEGPSQEVAQKTIKVFIGISVTARRSGDAATEVTVVERRLYPTASAEKAGETPRQFTAESKLAATFSGAGNEITVNNRKFIVTVK